MGHGVEQLDDVTRKPIDNRFKERPQSHLPSSKRTWYPDNKNMTTKVRKVMEMPTRLDEEAMRKLKTQRVHSAQRPADNESYLTTNQGYGGAQARNTQGKSSIL